ncbi:MAG: hypothetical protein HYR96_02700 [Deltaproteobacteria bacterium]|nr:hypothetical protein [Deltaproteobacteria bacterium]MBI3294855.1 hypothetical protein [Deltaproteobacteria bacterium]
MSQFIVALLFALPAVADVTPTQIDVPVHRAYIPIGFDDNDNAQVTVEGIFSDTCYRVGPARAVIHSNNHTIAIHQTAYRYGGICVQLLIPFTKTVDIGFTPRGNFAIVDAMTGMNLGDLPITRAPNEEADDFLYAPIGDAYVRVDTEAKTNTLVLTGAFSDRCTVIKDVKVNYYKDVLVVQPIAEHTSGRADCSGRTRFQKLIELKSDLRGTFLLHVRSMEGKAINKMIDIP